MTKMQTESTGERHDSFIPAAFIVDVIFVVVVADVCMLRLAFYGYFFTYKRITLSLLVSSKSNI